MSLWQKKTADENQHPEEYRQRCYDCFRPIQVCYCHWIPRIENRTQLLILQHRRERFHPFNTARMVHRALDNSKLFVDGVANLSKTKFAFANKTGLLFPGKTAKELSQVPTAERPDQLVILDGTWHQARQLYRDIPQLHQLPQYKITPQQPGQYRIRREPSDTSLATVEATVAALRELEPETKQLDKLIEAFDRMINDQLAHPKSNYGRRVNRRRHGTPFNIPIKLIRDIDNIVVAYGESAGGHRVQASFGSATNRLPVFWVARRLSWQATEADFVAAIKHADLTIDRQIRQHLELSETHFERALTPSEFRQAWSCYLRPSDTLAVYNQSTLDLLNNLQIDTSGSLVLKGIQSGQAKMGSALPDRLAAEKVEPQPISLPGRAGRRLAGAIALASHYHKIGNTTTG